MRTLELIDGDATFVLLADRHTLPPRGFMGGTDASPGRHTLLRDGTETPLGVKTTVHLRPGDRIAVQTPGGAGYGDPAQRDPAARETDRRNELIT